MTCHCILRFNFIDLCLLFVCIIEPFFKLVDTKTVSFYLSCYPQQVTDDVSQWDRTLRAQLGKITGLRLA